MSTTDIAPEHDTGGSAAASRPLEITLAVVALLFSAGYLYLSTQIVLRREAPPGQIDARFWPLVLGTTAVAIAVLLLVVAIARPAPTHEDIDRIQPGGVVRVLITGVLTVAFVAVWSASSAVLFGYRVELFPVATALYLFALMFVYGQRRWVGLVVYPVALTALIYVLFGMLLRIPL